MLIITNSGKEASTKDCVNIEGKWYIKGKRKVQNSGEAYKIGQNWHLANRCWFNTARNGGTYCKITKDMVRGLRADYTMGYFKPGPNSLQTATGNWVENFKDPKVFYYPKEEKFDVQGSRIFHVGRHRNFNTGIYGANDNQQFDRSWADYRKKNDKSHKDLTFGLSFGVEFETSQGTLHDVMAEESHLVPVKDGSIDGYEYISVPMENELNTLYTQCYWLSRQCKVDEKTSLHLHIGNIPDSKEFTLAFYMLYYRMQNEIASMFSPHKKDVRHYSDMSRRKDKTMKDYCRFIPELGLFYGKKYINNNGTYNDIEITQSFEDVVRYWNDGQKLPDAKNRKNRHVRAGNNKWTYLNRYSIINMVNLLFENSGTIEFRYHEGALDFRSVSNWLLLNLAMVQFTKMNTKEILKGNMKITFNDIFDEFEDPSLKKHLISYIRTRKEVVKDMNYKNNIYLDEVDIVKKLSTWDKLKTKLV